MTALSHALGHLAPAASALAHAFGNNALTTIIGLVATWWVGG